MTKAIFTVLGVIAALLLVATLYLGISYLFMLAFNYVAGYFGFKQITFWVAVAIVFLLGFVKTTVTTKK